MLPRIAVKFLNFGLIRPTILELKIPNASEWGFESLVPAASLVQIYIIAQLQPTSVSSAFGGVVR